MLSARLSFLETQVLPDTLSTFFLSMAVKLGVTHFLDSEPSFRGPDGQIEISEASRRPWRSYWPPRSGSDLYEWLITECPQVLSWRFDPDQPFDRPWQFWTKLPLAKPTDAPSLNNVPNGS